MKKIFTFTLYVLFCKNSYSFSQNEYIKDIQPHTTDNIKFQSTNQEISLKSGIGEKITLDSIVFSYGKSKRVNYFSYNSSGKIVEKINKKITDAYEEHDEELTYYQYNEMGLLSVKKVIHKLYSFDEQDETTKEMVYTYSGTKLIEESKYIMIKNQEKRLKNRYVYQYDANGNELSKTLYLSKDTLVYAFDRHTWLYDEANILKEEAYYQFTNDGQGNRVPYLIFNYVYTYKGDLLVEKAVELNGGKIISKTEFHYDLNNNLIFEAELESSLDNSFHLVKLTKQIYNQQNLPVKKSVENFGYNPDASEQETWEYDNDGNVIEYIVYEMEQDESMKPYSKQVYSYDEAGDIKTKGYYSWEEEKQDWSVYYVLKFFKLAKQPKEVIQPEEEILFSSDFKGLVLQNVWVCGDENCTEGMLNFSFYYSEVPTSSNEVDIPQLEAVIYPNPFIQQLNIKIQDIQNNENYSVQIFSVTGKLVFESQMNANSTQTFNLAHLPSGNYIVILSSLTQRISRIIIKQ